MSANLKARLNKLEACIAVKEVNFPSVVFGEFGRKDGEIIGVGSNGQNVARQTSEPVEDMIARAQLQLNQKIVFLIYAEGGLTGDACIALPKPCAQPGACLSSHKLSKAIFAAGEMPGVHQTTPAQAFSDD